MYNPDCIRYILRFINRGSDYKCFILICRLYWETCRPLHKKLVRRFSNHSLTIISMLPDRDWNWYWVSQKTDLTMEFILDHVNFPWNWSRLTENMCFTIEEILSHPELPWNWQVMANRSDITPDHVEKYINKHWNWKILSQKMSLEFILSHPEKLWSLSRLLLNKNLSGSIIMTRPEFIWCMRCITTQPHLITQDMVRTYPDIFAGDESNISLMGELSIEFIKEFPDLPWRWVDISAHKNITWADILSNPQFPWFFHGITRNPNITIEIIGSVPDAPWSWMEISCMVTRTPGIRDKVWKLVLKHPEKSWDWWYVSESLPHTYDVWDFIATNYTRTWNWVSATVTFFTWELFRQYPHFPWDGRVVSKSSITTWDLVISHPEFPWAWDKLTQNPNISWDIIKNNPDRDWDWEYLAATLPWSIIKSSPRLLTYTLSITRNEHITWDIIIKNNQINWSYCNYVHE